jgi:hypothetical protein
MNRENGWERNTQEKKEKIYSGLRMGKKEFLFSPYVLTGDALCTVVYVNGVYIVGVL